MSTTDPLTDRRLPRRHPARVLLPGILALAAATTLSAHTVRGVLNPTLATAHVSSPSVAADVPIRVAWGAVDTDLRVVCFNVANTSPARADASDWPRITAVGFELPGAPSGFVLTEPLNGDWALSEKRNVAIPGRGEVTLDFVIAARVHPANWSRKGNHSPPGIPRGQAGPTRFCVTGPFPDTLPDLSLPGASVDTSIELLINGVVVGFLGVLPHSLSPDVGLWTNSARTVPLYPEAP